ncbi:hypothetical protein RvY_00911 [Ramazzottius varieornatus]|uniref:Uncharacterized protein n=1 Tax=Ramazzottius varieornatus TaxID=947166 RepID=A0A1D1UIG4_RAMVA|nr:hypothetical protein RvY_00911 [Ramazzottius varieornatus]
MTVIQQAAPSPNLGHPAYPSPGPSGQSPPCTRANSDRCQCRSTRCEDRLRIDPLTVANSTVDVVALMNTLRDVAVDVVVGNTEDVDVVMVDNKEVTHLGGG